MARLTLGIVLVMAAQVSAAETKVTVSGTHLCCRACENAVNKTLADVEDVTFKVDRKEKSVSITAASDKAAQSAVDALAKAGFHGKLDNEKLHFKPVKVPKGNVGRIELTGIHNCCRACTGAIKKALATVDGVEADTVETRKDSFVVEGNFSAAGLVESLLSAGFHVSVKE